MSFRLLTRSQYIRHSAHKFALPRSHFHEFNNFRVCNAVRYVSTDRSKIEHTLKMLREEVQKQDEDAQKLSLLKSQADVVKAKPPLKDRIIHEIKHYYHGFRLLALETRVSAKYLWRVLRGATLTRRERQQLVRTVSDLFRLVPFSFFIIVPFMELALPIFIKLFPNMLPSTFQESSKEEEKIRKQVKLRVEMAKFLQDTIEEIGLERKSNENSKSLEFAKFIKKARNEGGYVSNKEILKFSKLFEDELTLDNLGMGQLRSLCRLMGLNSLGSPEILRFMLNMKIRELKADDKQIASEGGVDALSSIDLQQACRARGMRSLGMSEQRLKDQLSQWLELSLNDKVPPSLLLLSRTLFLPEEVAFPDRLKAIMQNLPEGISETTQQKLTEIEGGTIDHKARISLIKSIEDAISKEKEAEKKRAEEEKAVILKKQKEEELEKQKIAEVVEAAGVVSKELRTEHIEPSISVETSSNVNEKKKDIEVDYKDLSSIEQIITGGPIHEAKHDIIELKEKVIEHTEDLFEIHALDGAFAETKVAKRLRNKLNTMIEDVDSLVQRLEDEKRSIEEQISDPAIDGDADLQKRRQVKIQDVIDSLSKFKENRALEKQDDEQKQRIEMILKSIDEDEDGIVDRQLVLELIELLEKHTDMKVSASQMASLIGTLKKEDEVASLTEDMRKVHEGNFEVPSLPLGPSSAGALNQPSEIQPDEEENREKISRKVENGMDIPNVDSKVTTTLRQSKQEKLKRDPPL